MLELTVGDIELYDEQTEEFVTQKGPLLQLEHSLVSLSKWESSTEKPFLGKEAKTSEETLLYIQCMTLNEDYPLDFYRQLTNEQLAKINEYIDSKMTATWFREDKNRPPSREIITAEVVYYWMVALQIPFETQTWHLNRLLTLIKVCNEKQQPPNKQKTNRRDLAAQRRALNDQRRAQMNTQG